MIYNHPIGKDDKWYISGIFPANWGIICYLPPPIEGTRFHSIDLVSTLQGINISHLGKRKIIFKMPFLGDMLVPWRVSPPCFLLSFSYRSFFEGRGISYLFAGLYCAGARTAAVTQVAVNG